jgi:uncharacterized protein (DUF433 family)
MSPRKVSAAQGLLISRDPKVKDGTPFFAKTRIPVQALFDTLIEGETIGDFARRCPRVGVEGASELLRRISKMIESGELSV